MSLQAEVVTGRTRRAAVGFCAPRVASPRTIRKSVVFFAAFAVSAVDCAFLTLLAAAPFRRRFRGAWARYRAASIRARNSGT
ncbi:hypothetical protein B5F40_09490 [Gordonibacter sp. An230]|nr:hypothetical protein B5F40_09490 [Gordonibacter sp. An230]